MVRIKALLAAMAIVGASFGAMRPGMAQQNLAPPENGLIREVLPMRAPFGGILAFRVVLQRPLEGHELQEAAASILGKFRAEQEVYLYFVLPGWVQGARSDAEALFSYYARYERTQDEEHLVFRATPPRFMRSQLSKIALRPGETVRGTWVDHYLIGHDAMSVIVVNAKGDTYRLSSHGTRWRIVDKGKRSGSRWMVSIPEPETTKEPIGLMFAPDGSLHMFNLSDQTANGKPFSIATPWAETNTVSGTGKGIRPEALPRVFDYFSPRK
jgi:hypothetical protein